MQINLNDTVLVRLTSAGRALHLAQFTMFVAARRAQGALRDFKYEQPIEDSLGRSTWQLHVLMKTFGSECFAGNPFPVMGAEIELVTERVA